MNSREIAKFVSGVAFAEVVNHSILMFKNILPLDFFGVMLSKTTNLTIVLAWGIVFLASIYHAWMKKA